jgi:antitoxin component HigA of HigAB toxin-antitoxin module
MVEKPLHPLAVWLEKQGLKQTELAEKIGCSEPHLSLILSRTRRASLPLAKKFSDFTGGKVKLEDFVQ